MKRDISKLLSSVANAFVGKFNMPDLLNKVIDTTMKAFNAEVCSIFLEDKDEKPGYIKCVAGSGFAKKIIGIAEYEIGEGLTGSVAKTGMPLNIKTPAELKDLEISGEWKGKYDPIQWPIGKSEFRNLLALPLKINDQIFGVIKVENKKGEISFSEEDLADFKTIANVIALTIENTRLAHKTKEQSIIIQNALADVANAVVGHFDMTQLLNRIVNTTMKTLNAEICSIFLEDKEKKPGYVTCVAGSGFAIDIVNIAEYKIGEGFTGAVVKLGQEFNIQRPEDFEILKQKSMWSEKFDHLQYSNDKSCFRNLIALPLKIDDQILGVIKVENKIKEKYFTPEDLNVLKTIANVIALAIQNTKLHQKTEEQSKTISNALAEVANAVVGPFKMPELLNQIINITMKTLNAEVCSIFLEDKENKPGYITCVAGSGFAQKIIGIAEYKIGEGLTGNIAKAGIELNIKSQEDLKLFETWEGKHDPIQWPSGKSEFRNLLALPLKIKDQIFGVIKVENKKHDVCFTKDDETIFKIVANVVALTIEKTRLQMRIEEQLKSISAMAGHRINNQITRYDGIGRKLKRLMDSKVDKEDIYSITNELYIATDHIKRMIEEFRNYGKPIKLMKEYDDVNRIIKDEIWLAEPPPSIKINYSFDYDIPMIELDSARFSESIKELLKNAKKAILSDKGYGTITINTNLITKSINENFIKITIDDDGPGIPVNFRVFEPFQSTDPHHTGLGLATVKENLNAHGGMVSIVEKEKHGACFELTIPIGDV